MFAESEHGSHGHGHGTGVPWLDIVVGLSAMFISVVSLIVSIQHGRTMEKMVDQNEKMVAADTMPFLILQGSQLDPVTHRPVLHLTLKNAGVGPAVIDQFQLLYKGVPYSDNRALLRACCSAAIPKDGARDGVIYSNISGTVMPARESEDVLTIDAALNGPLYDAFDQARRDMASHACYCSVLDECWQTDFDPARRPTRVDSCKPAPNAVLW